MRILASRYDYRADADGDEYSPAGKVDDNRSYIVERPKRTDQNQRAENCEEKTKHPQRGSVALAVVGGVA